MYKKFSVIIPVYNAEKTLRRCLDSLLCQDCNQVEIILVNDGSKDRSALICRDYASKFDCIVYIEQKNAGASSARNAGLAVATGEYITFVDSDDYVGEQYFAELASSDADFVVFSYSAIRETGVASFSFRNELLNAESHVGIVLGVIKSRIAAPWNKRFKRSIIEDKQLFFKKDLIIGEDFIFGLEYMLACETSQVNPTRLYCVDETGVSSITRAAKYEFEQYLRIYQYAFQIADACCWNSQEKVKLLQQLDYLFCRTAFASIGRCLNAKRENTNGKALIEMFSNQSRPNVKPVNFTHVIMRICIEKEALFVFRFIAWLYGLVNGR